MRPVLQAWSILASICIVAAIPIGVRADTVTVPSDQDTMILNDAETFSNGAGINVCVGRTGQPATRRALFRFDVAGAIPVGSSIDDVRLELSQIGAAANASTTTFDLHRLLAEWGEGGSDAPSGECRGTSAQLTDATWRYRLYDPGNVPGSPQWSTLGGDFAAMPSATATIDNQVGTKIWTSAQMIADVQAWLDNPSTNDGWLLRRTDETGDRTAVKFASRDFGDDDLEPALVLDFTPPGVSGACCFAGQSCQILSGSSCFDQGGTFQGVGTVCTPNPCPPDPIGACCADAGTCSVLSLPDCESQGGSFQGDGETCAAADCPVILEPFVDPLPIPETAQPIAGVVGGVATYRITAREFKQQLHRDLPPTTVWGYRDGIGVATYPGPTIEATANQTVTVEWVNDLRDTSVPTIPRPLRSDHYLPVAGLGPPPECKIHGAQDLAKTVQHLHGAHVEAAFDGYPEDTILPGTEHTYVYGNRQLPTTLWYHDHALGITRLNVYMGLAGGYVIRDAFEALLDLPSGPFETLLVVQDRSFNADGSLKYPAEWEEVFFGDTILVNGKVWPYYEVNRGKYRFRVLNGSNSRTYRLGLDRDDLPGDLDMSFVLIGTDGGLVETPLAIDEITLAPAERADIVIDFAALPVGTEVVMSNSAPVMFPGTPGVGVIPNVMKFVVQTQPGDTQPLPATLRPYEPISETTAVREREFVVNREADACGLKWNINGLGWDDIVEFPQLGTTEIWRFVNPLDMMMHPMHMHLVMFQVLDRTPILGGLPSPPDPTEIGWKDTVQAPPLTVTRVIARFEDYAGKFAYHCHIVEHEDHEMMRQFQTVGAIETTVGTGGLSWSSQIGATGYDVVRGGLSALRASGNFGGPGVTELCLVDGQDVTSVEDSTPPPVGDGFWYLVRSQDVAGNSTYDSGASSQSGLRDKGIAASGNDCP